MRNTFSNFSEQKQYLIGLVHRLLLSVKRKSRTVKYIKKYLRYEVEEYKELDNSSIHDFDDIICAGRRELAESLLEELERWEHGQKRF